uniref:SHSP domain-containing protein n=1 Tax=Syphacia muris TaxID=451379 RepID=A0A0N5AD55_9BILA
MSRRPLLTPFSPHFGISNRFFDDMDFERHFRPYWAEQPLKPMQILDDDDTFSITIDVSQFAPEELKVNIDNGQLIIEGKHDPKTDQYGQIERHFIRRLPLPKSVKPEAITSELTKEGMLTVQSPKKVPEQKTRTIPILRKD